MGLEKREAYMAKSGGARHEKGIYGTTRAVTGTSIPQQCSIRVRMAYGGCLCETILVQRVGLVLGTGRAHIEAAT